MIINMGHGTLVRVTAGDIIALILMVVVFACVVVAYFMAISSMVKAARAKSDRFSAGKLWFIGLFTTPVVLGLICCAIKDEKSPAGAAPAPAAAPASAQPAPAAAPATPASTAPAATPAPTASTQVATSAQPAAQPASQPAAALQAPAEGSAPAGE